MELFWKVSGQQGCQICTTGLPENIHLGLIQQENSFFHFYLLLYFVGDRSKSIHVYATGASTNQSQPVVAIFPVFFRKKMTFLLEKMVSSFRENGLFL